MYLPLISFVIPFYNRFALLKEALQSVLDSPFKDVEIVLIDDASDADGLEEILAFIKPFENIIYLRQCENLGPGAARNRGLTAAKGEWIFFMDSDDVIYSDVLPDLGKFLMNDVVENSDIVIIKSVHKFSDNHIENICYDTVDEYINDFFYGSHKHVGQLWNFCFRKIFLVRNNVRCPNTYTQEDWCFFLSAYCYAKKISIFHQCIYEYRICSSSLSLLGNEFKKQYGNIITYRRSFFRHILSLYESNIQKDKKQNIEHLLYTYILLSQWDIVSYQHNNNVDKFLNRLRVNISEYTDNWNKKIYIAPCFLEAQPTVELINSWYNEQRMAMVSGGGGVVGFIDANSSSPRAKFCKNNTGLPVYTINDVILRGVGDSVILIFGIHTDEIAKEFNTYGLVEGVNYVKTGLC
jgi:glycosyltransferase involved in cell wall biosynthesis